MDTAKTKNASAAANLEKLIVRGLSGVNLRINFKLLYMMPTVINGTSGYALYFKYSVSSWKVMDPSFEDP